MKKYHNSHYQRGFTLIEIIVVIVILGVIGVTLMKGLEVSLTATPGLENARIAMELANKRMNLILGQARLIGFDYYNDPCVVSPELAVCTTPTGFTVSSTITSSWQSNTNLQQVTVTVSGSGSATLYSLVANY